MQKSLLSLQGKIQKAVNTGKLSIILASASPRRCDALAIMLGSKEVFKTIVSEFEENLSHAKFKSAIDYNLATARKKAEHVSIKLQNSEQKTLIIAADTIVALGNYILEKPTSSQDAARMLHMLNDTQHSIHTSVVLYELPEKVETFAFTNTTKVKFAKLSDEEIDAYVATGEVFDKAGAYEIQGQGRVIVEYITGDFFNAVGLPAREFATRFANRIEQILGNK